MEQEVMKQKLMEQELMEQELMEQELEVARGGETSAMMLSALSTPSPWPQSGFRMSANLGTWRRSGG